MSALYSFMRKGLPYALVLMLFACGGSSGGGGDDDTGNAETNGAVAFGNGSVPDNVFIATLNLAQETPANDSTGIGVGVVLIDPATRLMRVSLTTAGISATSVHIRLDRSGTLGLNVISLTEISAGNGVWSAEVTLTEDQLTALQNDDFYVSVNSPAFPQEEIRGQFVQSLTASSIANTADLTPDTSGVNSDSFTNGNVTQQTVLINMLTGSQQVPANSSLAVAVGVVIIDATSQSMVASITSIGISGLSAHIHQAAPGANGTTIFALNETTSGSGTWGAKLVLTESQRTAFENGNYYFDIHSAAFPDGELRGQIAASSGSGNFNTGSSGITTGGAGSDPGIITDIPFAPGSVTPSGNTGNSATDNMGAGVPSFGNPAGSGIGSASTNDFIDANVPTFENPAESGLGSSTNF
jgi:hypothetical protein